MKHLQTTLLFVPLALIATGLAACKESEIRQYEVAKEKTRSGEEVTQAAATPGDMPAAGGGQAAATGPQRMLATIVPRQDATWFFKVTGPPDAIASQKEAFGAFMSSVRFDGSGPGGLGWDLPEGWHRTQSDSRMRLATIHVPPKGGSSDHSSHMELTVVRLGAEAGGLEANVNRWRRQIGLGPADEQTLQESTETIQVAGTDATFVDITGPGASGGGGGGMAGGEAPFAGGDSGGAAEPSPTSPDTPGPPMRPDPDGGDAGTSPGSGSSSGSGPLAYETPEGWQSNPGQSSMRVASFQVTEGEKTADVSVIPLRGDAGGTLMNVNRWRRQIGLQPIDEQQLAEDVQSINVDGQSGKLVDLKPSEEASGSGGSERILAAIVPREGQTWFFKMRGPMGLVGKQREAFERFVRSVRFEAEDNS